MKRLLIILAFVGAAFAQPDAPVVTLGGSDPALGYQNLYFYNGSNQLIYRCRAASRQNLTTLPTISAATNANPVVLTITGHGFDYRSVATTTPVITITGGTSAWAGINGTFIFTPTGANTGTIPVDSTTFSTLAGTFVVTTRAPQTTAKLWSIIAYSYDASSNLIFSGFAVDPTKLPIQGGAPSYSFACSSRASYGYE